MQGRSEEMSKLRRMTFDYWIINEDITAQVHWLRTGDGRKRNQIKLEAFEGEYGAYQTKPNSAYSRWYSYQGEDDLWEDDWMKPYYQVEYLSQVRVVNNGGYDFLDEKMNEGFEWETNYFGLLLNISDPTGKGSMAFGGARFSNRLALGVDMDWMDLGDLK